MEALINDQRSANAVLLSELAFLVASRLHHLA
jgi:hypothetical protein